MLAEPFGQVTSAMLLFGGILLGYCLYSRYRRPPLQKAPYKRLKLRINLLRGSSRPGALPRKAPAIRLVRHARQVPAGNL